MILSSLACLLLSIFSLLTFFVISDFKDDSPSLSFSIDSPLLITEGQSCSIPYHVNFFDALLSFSVSDNSIAYIQDDRVVAVSAGVATLRATATYNGQVVYASCQIIVSKKIETLSYSINVISGGYFQNESFFVQDDVLCFTFTLQDSDLNDVDLTNLLVTPSSTLSISKQINYYFLSASSDGLVLFSLTDKNFVLSCQVFKI